MKIQITIEINDDIADPDHEMGVTDEGHLALNEALAPYGDIEEIWAVEQ